MLRWRTSFKFTLRLALGTGFAILMSGCGGSGPPYSPADGVKKFEIEPGFRIEVFATEPDIVDPVAMEWDEYGRVYVVEDRGYPMDPEHNLGRVKLLQDTDGDGLPDRSTVFADKLVMPTGVMRWKKGVLVTDAPNVWYMEDTDADGRADVKRVVLTGFAFTNPQHMVNGPTYGLDNWIYLASKKHIEPVYAETFADSGSDIRFPDRGDIPPLKFRDTNVRFRPDTYLLEALSGYSQFGQTFDEWGNHFLVENPTPGRHEVIAARYLERNPDLLISSSMQELTDSRDVFAVTERPESPRVGEVSSGRITSACSITMYLGGAFPEEHRRVVFTADPANNLVFSTVLSPSGATFSAKRLHEDREFLASRDGWCRPVNFYVGPDGALYVLDYYRRVIEHAEWTSREIYESEAIIEGNERGRIYRIVPETNPPPLPGKIRLGDAGDEELVKELGNPNVWWRRTAQRLLVDRQSAGAVGPLKRLFQTSQSGVGRVHALWTLDGLGKLEEGLIERALHDPETGVRKNAIILAEQRLGKSPRLVEELLKMSADPDPQVRFQLLCTLGFVDTSAATRARESLLLENLEDRWMQTAALSTSSQEGVRLFEMAAARLASERSEGRTNFFRQVGSVLGARQKEREIGRMLRLVSRDSRPESEWWRAASLEGLAQGIRGRGGLSEQLKPAQQSLLLRLFEGPAPSVRRASLQLLEVTGLPRDASLRAALNRTAATAENKEANAELRADAIGLLGLADPAAREPLLKELVSPQEPEQVQVAAVSALGKIQGDEIARFFLERWRLMTPPVRNAAEEVLIQEPGRSLLLLEAVQNDQVQRWTIQQKFRLLMNRDESVRSMAEKLLVARAGERESVVERYTVAVSMDGDAEGGRVVFEEICAKCHPFNGLGKQMGPDLGEVRNRPPETLLADILIPNKSIAQGHESYVVEMAQGGTIDGVMGPQTPTTITLRQEEGKEHVIRRADIKELYVANLSAMPADLEEQVSVQQMADLLKYLKTGR